MAVNMVTGAAVTSDSALAEQYNAKVKTIIGGITKIQETLVAEATTSEENAAIENVLPARKAVLAATTKTWEIKGASDMAATQRFADQEFTPLIAKYLKAQDDFVEVFCKNAVLRSRLRRKSDACLYSSRAWWPRSC